MAHKPLGETHATRSERIARTAPKNPNHRERHPCAECGRTALIWPEPDLYVCRACLSTGRLPNT